MRDGQTNPGDLSRRTPGREEPRPPSERAQLPLASLPDPALLVDRDGRWRDANRAAEVLLGREPGELRGAAAAEVVQPWPPGPPGGWSQASARRADGQVIPVDAWLAPDDGGGQEPATVVVLRRADDRGLQLAAPDEPSALALAVALAAGGAAGGRRLPAGGPTRVAPERSGAALWASEARFRAAFADAPIGMALTTPAGRLVQVNRALCDILGYAEADLVGRPFAQITHPDDEGIDAGHAARLLAGERGAYQVEKRYLRKDGRVAWGRLSASLVRDEAGTPVYVVAQIQDITPYKAFGAALRASEARFRAAFADAPIGMALLAPDGRVAQANRALCAFLGRTEDDLIGQPAVAAVHPDDAADAAAAIARLVAGAAQTARAEHRYLHPGGAVVWGELSASLVRDEAGQPLHVVAHVQDVTERKRAEAELLAAKDAAEQASRLKSGFLSTMSHELRTPLTAIIGYADLLRLTQPDPEALADVDQIARSADQLLVLIDDLLDLSRIEAGRVDLSEEDVDLAEVVAGVAAAVAPQAAAKGLTLVVDVPADLPPVRGDAGRLRQLLLNLAGNAVKFTERGSVTIAARATAVGAGAGAVDVSVADTGIGIAAAALPHIFDEFRQADGSTTRRYGGSGLGLAIADRLARMHGGAIAVASEPAVGSTFTLHLPRAATA
jgi:PAS domain S-box-containing protein